jgi:hypothetical protein
MIRKFWPLIHIGQAAEVVLLGGDPGDHRESAAPLEFDDNRPHAKAPHAHAVDADDRQRGRTTRNRWV